MLRFGMKMLNKKRIEEYQKSKKLDTNLNFKMNRRDKKKLDKYSDLYSISTSELVRLLIREFIENQKDERVELNEIP